MAQDNAYWKPEKKIERARRSGATELNLSDNLPLAGRKRIRTRVLIGTSRRSTSLSI